MYLDDKVAQLQLCEDLRKQLEALSIWNHWLILSSYVEILNVKKLL